MSKAAVSSAFGQTFAACVWTLTARGVYARGMRFRLLFRILPALLLVTPAFPANAEEAPVVAVLRYSQGWFAPRAKIRMLRGTIASPLAGTAHSRWTLLPGDLVKQPSPPIERLIQFYNIKGNSVRVLCTVIAKYTRTPDGWRPAFALVQQPVANGDDDKSTMVSDEGIARANILVLAAAPADGDGFHSNLVFAEAEGPVSIDAWEVQ